MAAGQDRVSPGPSNGSLQRHSRCSERFTIAGYPPPAPRLRHPRDPRRTYDGVGGSGDGEIKSPSWTGPQATWPAVGADNDAVFGLSGGTVTVVGGIAVDYLSFTTPGYRIDGGALTLTGPSLVSVEQELSATIACEIAGAAAGITLAGPGTVFEGREQLHGLHDRQRRDPEGHRSGRLHSGVDVVSAVVTVNAGATLELDTWFVGDEELLGMISRGRAADRGQRRHRPRQRRNGLGARHHG